MMAPGKRKPKSMWSKINKDELNYLASENLIQEAGYKTIKIAKENDSWSTIDDEELLIITEDFTSLDHSC